MEIQEQISAYIAAQPEPKRAEILALHQLTLEQSPGCKLWFLDGKNEQGKVVSNPNIGHGSYTIRYADGTSREFYQIGLSANTTGISVYIMGLDDKSFLAENYAPVLRKATVTGYCIKFKTVKDIDLEVLVQAIRHGFAAHAPK